MTEPWYADGLRFTCSRCGNCCRGPEPGFVEVDAHEISAMAKQLGLSLKKFGKTYLRRLDDGRMSLVEKTNYDCVFWEDGTGCQVYEVRPTQCRTFPFWPELLESKEAWDEEAIEVARAGLVEELAGFEASLEGDFLTGELGVADYALYALMAHIPRYELRKPELGISAQIGPKLRAWQARIEALPYFDGTYPPHWR